MKIILRSGKVNNKFDNINIQWAITRRCNFCCSFCGVYDNNQKELSLKENMNICDKILTILPSIQKTIVLIGGEPTLYKDYERLLEYIIQNKKEQDVICIFSNGSEDIKKLQNNIDNQIYQKVIPLYTYHSHANYAYPLQDKLKLLINNNISFKVNMMITENNLQKVKNFYKDFQSYHNDNFIFECVPIEQINIEEYLNELSFCQYVNNKNEIENFMNVFYDIYDTKTNEIDTEVYSQSRLKLLPKEYFKFIGFKCFSRYRLSIDSDGLLYDFCDRCFFNTKKTLGYLLDMTVFELTELIKKYRICTHTRCPICDTSLLYKEKITSKYQGASL